MVRADVEWRENRTKALFEPCLYPLRTTGLDREGAYEATLVSDFGPSSAARNSVARAGAQCVQGSGCSLPQDFLLYADAGTEGVAVVVDRPPPRDRPRLRPLYCVRRSHDPLKVSRSDLCRELGSFSGDLF